MVFYFSGSATEGVLAFPVVANSSNDISFVGNQLGAAAGALGLSSGSYLAVAPTAGNALVRALPSDSGANASVCGWVKCSASTLSAAGLASSVLSWGVAGIITTSSQQQIGLCSGGGCWRLGRGCAGGGGYDFGGRNYSCVRCREERRNSDF